MEHRSGERTRSVHGPDDPRRGSLVTPIHQTSTFVLEDAADVDAVYEGRREGDIYARYTNPSVRSVERRLASLEGTEAALVFASGMAAIATTLLTLVPQGGRIVANADLYGGTLHLLRFLRDRFGVRVDHVPTGDVEGFRRALRESADLLYVESPTNPTLRLVDLAAVAEAARSAGVTSVADSTLASPVGVRPHALGIDVVVHSATKYLGGHADLTAGVACTTKALAGRLHATQKLLGPVLDPHAAFLLERGVRTLPLRFHAQGANAQAVAEALAKHPAVLAVHYPGLPTHPQHALARRQFAGGFGGLLSFDLPTLDAAKRFLDALRLVRKAASFGGVESLCSIPYQQSHRGQPRALLDASGITEGTVRLAIGVEDTDDLVRDVLQAVDAATRS